MKTSYSQISQTISTVRGHVASRQDASAPSWKMKNRNPQISQITQMVKAEEAAVGCKEYQADVSPEPSPTLCNLRNLRIGLSEAK
jgi:hypothetical protein